MGLGGSGPGKGEIAARCGVQGAGYQWPAGQQNEGLLRKTGAGGCLHGGVAVEGEPLWRPPVG